MKARIASRRSVLEVANRIGKPGGTLVQTDTYFQISKGRLKLREFSTGGSELIFYERNEGRGDRWSVYEVFRSANAAALKKILSSSLARDVVVKKRRSVFFYRGARIHIDSVMGLGDFIEFEVVLRGENRRLAKEIYEELRSHFGLRRKDVIRRSYADLLRSLKR